MFGRTTCPKLKMLDSNMDSNWLKSDKILEIAEDLTTAVRSGIFTPLNNLHLGLHKKGKTCYN